MSLPDFADFEPFNRLRQDMGTDQLGFFELFNPVYHLTGQERSDLDRLGLRVERQQVQMLLDFTLVYKNSRVLVMDNSRYHLSACADFPVSSERVRIVTSMQPMPPGSSVCRACLQTLHFQGYDANKARKEAYSHQVFETFKLSTFWRQYPVYPVSEKREKRKPLS